MIVRGNGAGASKAVSVRVGREALLRKALLGSTALIGITLATPALAQSTNPAGGGTITGNGTYTDGTATNGGVQVDNTQSTGITMTGVTINNTSGNPNGSAYKQTSSGQGVVLYTEGANSLRTDQNGAALFLQAAGSNLTWGIGQTDNDSTIDLTGTYGAYLVADGSIDVLDFGTTGSLRNVTGINGDTGIYANSIGSSVNLQLRAPVISGFTTGIYAGAHGDISVSTTGGSIATLTNGRGINAVSSGGTIQVVSGSAITTSGTGIGIKTATTNGTTYVTTTAGGTINGGQYGIQVDAAATGQTTTVAVGAAIGDSTRPSNGVSFLGTGVVGGNNYAYISANISSGSGSYAVGSANINTDLEVSVASATTVTSQGSTAIMAGRNLTVINHGTISATGASASAVYNAQGPSTLTVTNTGTMTAGGTVINAAAAVDVGNFGTITATNFAGVVSNRGGIITNSGGGTITGGSSATSGWAILFNSSAASAGQTISNASIINGGGAGAIRIDASAASTLNFVSGSTTTGLIKILGSGTTTTTLGGALNGNYDASTATGVQNFTLASTGSMQGATFGSGNDTFIYQGGSISGTIDGGAGTDTFAVDVGSSTNKTLDLATLSTAFTNFESYGLLSGNLTLTGSRDGGLGWTVAGGNATTFILNGSLTNITGTAVTLTTPDLMFVQSGAQLSATGDVIYSAGNGNNIQNSGTITSGTGASSAIAIGSGTVDNYGTITYASGGSITTQGNGVIASSNQLSLGNHTGATLIGRWDGARANNGAYIVNDGLIQGDRFAGVEISGTSVVYNNATGRIYGATGEGSGLLINNGAVQVTNAGQIVGGGPAGIYNAGSGLLSLSNSGTIATGTLDGSNNYVQGGTTTAIRTGTANITNTGTIRGASGGIAATGALTLVNIGMINGTGTGTLALNAVDVGGVASILNAGTISEGTNFAISATGGGTVTNAVGASLGGGNDATNGYAVYLNGGTTFNNYGQAGSGTGSTVLTGSTGGTINLFAGSASGRITGGSGNDTLAIYTAQTNASAVTQGYTNAVTGSAGTVTLQNSGALAAATYGAIDLGGGSDTLQLRGTGTGASQGTFSLANATGVETITKLDGGTWVLSGAAAGSGLVINSNGGTLIFQGTSGIGTINANGGILLANGSGAFNGAVVHLLTSNVQFGASGVYANNFVLDVPAVLNGQAAVFENLFGGNAILSGSITSGSGTNAAGQAIGTSQAVTFAGIGGSLFNLTGTGNSWTGITTINSGVTVRGSTSAISGGSITNNGTLTYIQSGASSIGTVISGSGALRVEGGQVTLTGFNTYTGGTTVAGGTLQVGDGGYSGRIAGAIAVDAGGTLVFNRADNYDFTSAISGAGNLQALGTVSLSGAITTTGTFTVDSATGGQVTLTGSRSGANSSGVTLAGSGNILRVGLSGSVAGGQYVGVRLGGTNDGVDNFGSITNTGTGGDNGYGAAIAVVATTGTSTINNGSASNSTATISGQNAGINHVGSGGVVATGLLTVNNYGLIAGNLYNAIENQGGSGNLTVTNYSTGRIVGQGNAGGGNGIGMGGAGTLTLTNAGLIVGRTNGVATSGTVNITNQNGGVIAAGTLSSGTSGTLIAGGGNGIQAVGGTIINQAGGVIRGSFLSGGGSDTNAITSTAATTITNSGQILGVAIGSASTARTNGVYVSGGLGTVTNNATGLITGGWDGVYITAGGTVTNSGTIVGNLFNGVENATRINNNAGGRILGVTAGASMLADAIVDNSGTIASASYNSSTNTVTASSGTGLLVSSASVANQYNGTISGATGISATGALSLGNSGLISGTTNAGVRMSGANSEIYNNATITGGSDATQGFGVIFANTATGSLTNRAGSLVSGGTGGFFAGGTATYIDNSGSIVGLNADSIGAYFQSTGNIATNQTNGLIVGQGTGVAFANAGNVNNSGFIGSGTLSGGTSGTFTVNANGIAVSLNGGYVSNYEGATITGGLYGIVSGGITAVNIANYGTINATTAINLIGNNNDTVTLGANSVTNGAIALGNGSDTLNWYGGSFTSIDGGNGNDQFVASISAPATLDLSTITSFESHNLNGGGTLTLTGTQAAADGGWTVNSSTLVLGGTAKLEMTGTGVTLNNVDASLSVNAGGQLIAHDAYGVAAYAGGGVTNAGLIKSTGNGWDGVITNGGTVDNETGGRIIAAGNGVTLQAYGTTLNNDGVIAGQANGVVGSDDYQTLNNTGVIVAGTAGDNATAYWQTNANLTTGDGVRFTAGGSVTNVGGYVNGNTTGIIAGGANGVTISGGAATIENSGVVQGNSGYGISLDTAAGQTSTVNNYRSGSVYGGTGSMLLAGDGTINVTNAIGSWVNGDIISTGNGVRNIDLAGTFFGGYDASSGAGIDNVTLRFTGDGAVTNVNLGDGDDSFTYIGGAITGLVDGGAGNDKLFADFGAGQSYNVSLANFTGFESLGLVSGDMTLTGPSSNPGQAIYAGVDGNPAGTITFDGTSDLTGDIYVNGGSIRAATAGAFGSGTIHMIDPTATFGASGTYANNISLEVVTPSSANPSTLNADSGVVATLTGAITTSGAAGVDPSQDLVFGGQGTIVLTNTANSWLGTTTVNSGTTLQGASDTISGSAIVNNGTLNYLQAYGGTVAQDISGNGSVNVAGVAAGNTLTFAGTNTLKGTFTVYDASAIAFSGATSSGNLQSVALAGAGSRLDVTATGSLSNNNAAGVYGATVGGYDANQSVYNLGSITSTGTGSATAVYFSGANALLDNSGNITGNRTIWVDGSDVQLINRAGGTITGNSDFALYLTQNGTIDNSGTIQTLTAYPAVYVAGTAAITNNAGGLITSQGTALAIYGAGSSLTNAGSITSSDDTAVYLAAGGTVTNSGTIAAGTNGVGVWTSAGATFTNQAGGTITGGYAGLYLDGASLVTVNLEAGSTTDKILSGGNGDRTINIAGTLNGGYFGGAGADAITLDTSATVNGTLDGGDGNDTLALTGSGPATLGAVLNIESATKSGTGTWTISAPTSMTSWSIADGTLLLSGGNAIADTASVAMTGGTLQLGASEAIGSLSGIGNVALGANALTLAGNGTNFAGTISGSGDLVIGGTATLSGANAYTGQTVVAGTLTLGASNVLADASTLIVQAGGTVDLGANSDTVAIAAIGGTLAGTGTLTASQYQLTGATVNANLGAGTVFNLSGNSALNGNAAGPLVVQAGTLTLNGTAGGDVAVNGGTLALGAANRLADTATVVVASGATFNVGAFNDTIGVLGLNGTLAGTGTLTASEYQLTGATVNANLGAGTVLNLGGASVLNGNAAGPLVVQAGTLALGASNRLADTATVAVASGATLDIGSFNDTVGMLGLAGTLAGTGTLTASEYQLTGATVNANLGTGTVFNLSGNSTLNGNAAGPLVVQAGVLALNGTAGGDVAVNGGTLALGAANRLADTATVTVSSGATLSIGAFNDTIGVLGLNGTLAGTGTLTASQYQLTGATVNANLGAGTVFNLSGTSTLNGTAAGDISVQGGTLALGASNRLADTATVAVSSGATLNIGAFNDTVGVLGLNGTLAGTGTLTASQYQLTGATVNANLGAGTVFNLGGTSTLNGAAAGDLSVQAGTLALGAANRLADTANVAVASGATLNLGAFNDTIGVLGLNGTLAGTGTLTASQYQLTGATVNANLGSGTVFNLGGTSTLSGTAAGDLSVQGGTLTLGASNRLADTATVLVSTGATLNLGANSDTVAALALGGTLAGTGTLTAAQYQLTAATVNANLGAGTLTNMGGISVLSGTAAANTVTVQAGTLRLGASDRLADTAVIGVASGATFDLANYNETVASLAGTGTIALGTGRLTLNSASSTGFGGAITGSGTIDKQGIGTLTLAGTFATTGRFDVSAGTLAFSGSTQGGIRVQGGTLIGGGTLAGALTINSGTFSPGGLATGALGAINPIGSFTTGSLVATGGTLLFDFGGTSLNFASDSIKVNGTATLTGGTVQVNALTSAASDYRFQQLYTIVQANALTGTFANGSVFATVASNPNLKWRLRYDLVANAVVLQVQKNMEFNDGVAAGDTNTLAVANALSNSTTGNASDQWASTLNTITALSTGQRVAAFKTFSGEILANVSTATISANNLFTDLLRQRVGDGSDALIGGGFTGSSLADVRTTTTAGNNFASALSGATLPGANDGDNSRGGIWGQVYGGYQKLLGDGVHAGVDNTTAGVAMGIETRMDGFTAGIAGGVAQIDSDMDSRYSTVSGNQYQLGGYLSYDAGGAFVAASGSWYSSDLNSKRTLALGSTTALATGDIHSTGYAVGLTGGFRTEFSNGLRLALIGTASKVRNEQDGYTENAAGGLGLQVASANRDLFTAGAELRLGAKVKTGAGVAMPWVSMGVRYNSGDLDTVGNVRFSGAPSGTGAFGVQGVKIAPVLGTLGVGIDARASKNVRLGVALEGSAGENTREGRASVRVKIGF